MMKGVVMLGTQAVGSWITTKKLMSVEKESSGNLSELTRKNKLYTPIYASVAEPVS